eukprot:gene31495-40900_t
MIKLFGRTQQLLQRSNLPSPTRQTLRKLSNFHPLGTHRDTEDNNVETYFDFSEENFHRVELILGRYPANYKQAGIIPLLDLAQRQCGGWLPLAAMDKVAKIVGVSPIRVYEVATFYTMFNREKIKQTIEKHLGIHEGETTPDGLFTLREVECMGSCANAPMVQLNDDYYECLTPATTVELLESCKKGRPPVSCEGPLGKTSMFVAPSQIDYSEAFKRVETFEQKVNPADVKNHMGY